MCEAAADRVEYEVDACADPSFKIFYVKGHEDSDLDSFQTVGFLWHRFQVSSCALMAVVVRFFRECGPYGVYV